MVVILWRKALYRAKSDGKAEIKRVWVEPEYRGQHIASRMIIMLEEKAKEKGFRRMILQKNTLKALQSGYFKAQLVAESKGVPYS